MEAIQLILSDHREFEKLFKEFERAERAADEARQTEIVRSLVRELSVHASIEEQFVYPVLRERTGDAPVLDALEEHHAVKLTLDELDAMAAGTPRYAAKVRLLVENVRRHVQEEERELLPALERLLDDSQRRELGETLARAKRAAPTRPHPASPDTPPGNFVASAFAAVLDRSRDALRDGGSMLTTIVSLGAKSGYEGTRKAARRAQETLKGAAGRSREAVNDARTKGREAVDEVRAKGREAVEEVRAAVDRVEVRSDEAARHARASGRAAGRAAKAVVPRTRRRTRRGARSRARRTGRRSRR